MRRPEAQRNSFERVNWTALARLLQLTPGARNFNRERPETAPLRPSLRVAGPMMRHSVSRELYAYWNRLRGARAAPDRSDIDPDAIRHVLADSFIVEVESACVFPIRLSGTRLNALWLSEQKGRSFLDLWRAEDRRNVAAALLTVVDGATPIVAGALARSPNVDDDRNGAIVAEFDRDLNFELLLLPLRHYGKTHSRLLGSLSSANQTSWFGRAVASPLFLKSLRIIRAQDPAPAPRPSLEGAYWRRTARPTPRLIVHEGGKSRL